MERQQKIEKVIANKRQYIEDKKGKLQKSIIKSSC